MREAGSGAGGDGDVEGDDGSSGTEDDESDVGASAPQDPFAIAKQRVALTHRALRLYNSVRQLSNTAGALV